jgi:GxxExxY protein
MEENGITKSVIGAAVEVHRELGPGLLESAYRTCLTQELRVNGIRVESEVSLPVIYRGMRLECGYRVDLEVLSRVVYGSVA